MENIFIHPDALSALREQLFLPLLNGNSQQADKIMDALAPKCIADLNAPLDLSSIQILADELNRLKKRDSTLAEYCSIFSPALPLSGHKNALIDCIAGWTRKLLTFSNDKGLQGSYRELFELLWPHDVKGRQKIRIGGERDGGYVFLEPGEDGVAYSFGVSARSPWDLEMAQRGYKVYQFDGTIKDAPDKHPNLRFTPKNIVARDNPAPHEKNISQIFEDLGHKDQKDIILQIDIEGGEWDFFENIGHDEIIKFGQIIAEFHRLLDPAFLPRAKKIFEKILRTHVPVHFHYNNCSHMLVFPDFMVSSLFEVTFVAREGLEFMKSSACYPTPLDRRNVHQYPEVYIGRFSDICDATACPA